MKVLEEINVSVYPNVYSKSPEVMSFFDVVSRCVQPVHATAINTIRRYFAEGDREAAQKLKNQLPCFTPAGTFNGAHAIKSFLVPSHIVGLDYDHVPDRLAVIQQCAADIHTVAALESPTDGVKVFAYVEGVEGRYREGQQLVSRYYNELLGLTSDPACKDESRLCFFTYSPNGYIASLYQAFELEATDSFHALNLADSPNAPEAPFPETSIAETPGVSRVVSEEEINKFLSSYIFLYPLTPGQRHTNLFKLACEACRRGYPQEGVLRGISEVLAGSDFNVREIKSVLSSGYQKVGPSSPTIAHTSPTSSQKDKRTKRTDSTFGNDNETEEAYWQGEEYRKQTPFFPNELYDNLPILLNECVLEEEGDRERDISFLSDLTALSAAMPQTFGIYNHKKYSPHFFSFVIAPAGSGKSVAQTGRYLLEEIHQSILSASEQRLQNYNLERNQWQLECAQKKRSKDKCSEEPEKPAFKMLFIPATVSYTRMQTQMRDNGPQGSIIYDTEAQTLSTANHLDCGHFDDMLRKAFEHENIDSLFKANGIKPIYIRHPKLAMFLTGTPGQLDGLLEHSENGLVSRILIYTYRLSPRWKEMGDDSVSLEDSFKPLAHRVFELYHFCQNHPVLFHLSRKQWDRLNETFASLLTTVALEGNDDLQAVVKRYAFLVMRLSMIQARVRQFEANDFSPEIYCDDADFERSLQIVLCCYEHSRLLLSSMNTPTVRPLRNPDKIRDFIKELPDTFTKEDAIEAGVKHDFHQRKISRILKAINGVKIKKLSHGVYAKLPE